MIGIAAPHFRGETKVWTALLLLSAILIALLVAHWVNSSELPRVKKTLLFVDRISPKPKENRAFFSAKSAKYVKFLIRCAAGIASISAGANFSDGWGWLPITLMLFIAAALPDRFNDKFSRRELPVIGWVLLAVWCAMDLNKHDTYEDGEILLITFEALLSNFAIAYELDHYRKGH
jgi:hypothetical protein